MGNGAGVKENQVILECHKTNSSILWSFKMAVAQSSDSKTTLIYSNNRFNASVSGRYFVNLDDVTGQPNLVITELQMSDAGRYDCDDGTNVTSSELIVIGND